MAMEAVMDIHNPRKEHLVSLKDLTAIVIIVNVKRDMYIVVDMAKEDTVRFDPFFLLLILVCITLPMILK